MAFSYLLIIIYDLRFGPVCWVYAVQVWSLETRATDIGIAALGIWLFSLALGLYIPPGLRNTIGNCSVGGTKLSSDVVTDDSRGMFRVMCILGATQFYFTFPETCNKSLEETEFLFSKQGPHVWKTKPGESRLDALVAEAREKHLTVEDAKDHRFNSIDPNVMHAESVQKHV